MTMNIDQFQYRRWSHVEMDAFIRQCETCIYEKRYIHCPHDIQCIDSFRYIHLFYLGGSYIDMDDARHRPFRELVVIMEALDPYSNRLTLFPSADLFGIQNTFMIRTTNH